MARNLLLLFFIAAVSCKNNIDRKLRIIEKDGLTIKGYAIRDTIFDDTVYYYNSEDKLMRKELYANGKLNGFSEEFYNNGNIKSQTAYSNGLKNGANNYYNYFGKRIYSDNYYHDLAVGPVVYYDTSGMAKRFYFISFDNKTLLDIDYTVWKGVSDFVPKLVNYTYEIQQVDSVQQANIFLYIIKPPRFLTKYSLYKRNKKKDSDQTFIANLSSQQPFIDYSLPVLNEDYYYVLQLDIYDSIINKRSIINREVW